MTTNPRTVNSVRAVFIPLLCYTFAMVLFPFSASDSPRKQITIPKGRKQAVEAHAKSRGESVNGLVNALIRADMGLSEDDWRQVPGD